MKRRTSGGRYVFALLLCAVGFGLLLALYRGREESPPAPPVAPPAAEEAPVSHGPGAPARQPMPPPEEDIPTVVPEETPPVVVEAEPGEESPCEPLAKDLEALFLHMEARAAFRKLFSGQKASRVLPEILRKLSQSPPLPAGEASDGAMMLKNIHHFFRILSPSELRLLKELLSEDTETVEWNLQLGYAWFRAADRCPDLLEFKPSPQAAYAYAGFFVNTIGGKAYLVRRPSTVRVLVTYYSLLVLDQADKGGANVYGVDLLPPVQALREELRHYRGLRRHRVYMQNLREMETRLLKKRGKA